MDASKISLITGLIFNIILFASGVYGAIHLARAIRQRRYGGVWPYLWRAWLISVFVSPAFYLFALFVLKWELLPLLWWFAMVKWSSLITWWIIVFVYTLMTIIFLAKGIIGLVAQRNLARLLVICLVIIVPVLLFQHRFLRFLWWFAVFTSGLLGAYFVLYAVAGLIKTQRHPRGAVVVEPETDFTPTVSVIIPCHNEEAVVAYTLQSMEHCDYPQDYLEIIVVNDASTDGTVAAIQPYVERGLVKLINRPVEVERGKAISVNEGIKASNGEFICILDADHEVIPPFISQLVFHFKNPRLGLVQGGSRIKNVRHNWLTRFTDIEQSYVMGLRSFAKPIPLYMGSGAMFRRSVLEEVGEFNNALCTEDWEMCFRIYEHGYGVIYDPTIRTWHQAVTNLRAYYHQHYRWMRGTVQAFALHWRSFYTNENISLLQKIDFTEVLLLSMTGASFNIASTVIAISLLSDWQLLFPYLPFLIFPICLVVLAAVALHLEGEGENFLLLPGFVFYVMSHTVPNLAALVDELILQKKTKGQKAERVVYTSAFPSTE